ncbi:hypothetical protein INS49_013713 [Diaporthe citri]|uniref:uncharacterized protein n=1 Tax=Diaporthe citri TaxID=83186 RepID=UPI001C7E9F96|nr:uncharacterized protein INS49_013713 [Diaporthe citri]KAG6357832.1 hypothetical protein INS49_013713 [Diaporthe citri]
MASSEDWGWGYEEPTEEWGLGYDEPTTLGPAQTETTTKASTKVHRNKPAVQPWQTCSKKDIEPYRKYKILYGERKFAQEFTKQNLSFTDDLPTEIRLRIYDFLFPIPGDQFEFWAPQEKTRGKEKWQNLFRKYASNKKAMRIMRLSKKIREEVADYFYGRFNMRFSDSSGFLVMTMFNHSIRFLNCSFINHITVRMPCGYLSSCRLRRWDRFTCIQRSRGMRIPFIGRRAKQRSQGGTEAECNHDITVRRGFRQLRDMAGLKLLEILVPWDYLPPETAVYDDSWQSTVVPCDCEEFQGLSSEDQIRHRFEEHCYDSEYWELLATLKQQTSSDDLTIALVYDYNSARRGRPFEDYENDGDYVRSNLRGGRWVAAYAAIKGYEFGYARPAEKGVFKVRYDEDTVMSKSLELLKDDPLEYDPLLEPPELSG